MGRHAPNKQGNGYKTNGNFLASHPFILSGVSDYQVTGEGSKGGHTGLISGLSEGVLEDEREREVSRRQPKRVFHARAGRRSRTSRGPEVATKGRRLTL